MGRSLSIILVLCLLNLAAFAQNGYQQCPSVVVSGPAGMTRPGDNIKVSAIVTPSFQNAKYSWYSSAGKIIKDQESPTASIRTTIEDNFSEIVVRVEIDGLPKYCPSSATAKFGINNGIYDVFPIDEFRWNISKLDEAARLDNLAIQLNESSEFDFAYIVLGTEKGRNVVEQRIRRMKDWLFNKRKFPNKTRYIFLLERSGREEIKFWLVPPKYHPCPIECVEIP